MEVVFVWSLGNKGVAAGKQKMKELSWQALLRKEDVNIRR